MTNYPTAVPDTILYIDQCVERWQPFLKDVGKERQGRLAYLFETEANYLKSTLGPDDGSAIRAQRGATLKFVFPLLKHMGLRLALEETSFELVCEAGDASFDDLFPEHHYGCTRHDRLSEDEKRAFLGPLMERAHATLIAYERIVNR